MQTEDKIKNMDAPSAPQKAQPEEDNASYALRGLGLTFFSLLGPFWSAFVFLWLWRWFIVPLGIQNITFWHSLGFVAISQFLLVNVRQQNASKGLEKEDGKPDLAYWKRLLWRGNLMEAFYLFVGWLAHFGVHHLH